MSVALPSGTTAAATVTVLVGSSTCGTLSVSYSSSAVSQSAISHLHICALTHPILESETVKCSTPLVGTSVILQVVSDSALSFFIFQLHCQCSFPQASAATLNLCEVGVFGLLGCPGDCSGNGSCSSTITCICSDGLFA